MEGGGNVPFLNFFAELPHDFYLNFIKDERYMLMLQGLGNTLLISFFAIVLGILFGTITFFLRRSRFSVLRGIGYVYVDVIRATPMVTQLLIIYFVIFGAVDISPILVAILAFGFNSGAYVSEILRAGFQSIDRGQMEAGRSLGLSSRQTMIHIIAPQAIKNTLPTLCNEFIVLIKETAVAGYISIQDLTRAADMIRSLTYDAFLPLIVAALIYYSIIKILTLAIARLERHLRASDHR